jgi:hypothetical protein
MGRTYNCGCMGLRSVPITFAEGNSEAGTLLEDHVHRE